MKILYIGNERRDAQTVAKSLRGITENVPLTWAQSLDQGARHLAQNRDLAALVIDASIHAGKWPPLLKDIRSLPHRPAIVVVMPQGTRPTFDSQTPPPDDYVINGPTFSEDLPVAINRSVARLRKHQTPSTVDALFLDAASTPPSEVDQKLATLTAALQHAERRHAAAMAAAQAAHELAATEQLTEQERLFQGQMALEQDKRRAIEETLAAATSAREEAERRCASAVTDAAAQRRELERISKREAELAAQSQSERATRAALEQRIAEADARAREWQQRHDDARGERESAAADVARLTQRETDLSAQLATVRSELLTVQGHLSDAVRDVEDTRQSAAREHHEIRSAAADVERALRDEIASLHAQGVDRQASFDAQLASERLDYDKRLAGMRSECERLGQACAAANADVERLNADLSDAKGVIDVTRREFEDAHERLSAEHATAVAALTAQIAERDERLREAALRHDAAQDGLERARAELQQSLHTALAVGRHDIDQVQQALMATLEAVRATRRQQDILQANADRVAEAHDQQFDSAATNPRVVQQPDIAGWQQLTKDPALV
jgi:chromosome segregation ATPase